jgi:hypothetical protein
MKHKNSVTLLAMGFFLLVVMLGLFPLIVSFWYSQHINKQISFYNTLKGVHVELIRYDNHWLSSDALISVEIDNSKLLPIYSLLGMEPNQLPEKFKLVIYQQILHGPIIYKHITEFPFCFSWARVDTDLIFKQENFPYISLSQIKTSATIDRSDDLLRGASQFKVEKIYIDKDVVGPLYFQINTKNLNENAVDNLVTSFKDIMERGELYRDQMQQKMLYLFPSILTPGSSFQLTDLTLKLHGGRVLIKGELVWPVKNYFVPDDLAEFMRNVDFYASVRISKKILEQFITYFSEMPYFREMSDEDKRILLETQSDISLAMKRNGLMMMSLVLQNQMREKDATELVYLQESDLTGYGYRRHVKELFLSKQISLDTSFLLYWQYLPVLRNINMLNEQLHQYQDAVVNDFNQQLTAWIKNGYLIPSDFDYQFFISREAGIVKLNDKVLQ